MKLELRVRFQILAALAEEQLGVVQIVTELFVAASNLCVSNTPPLYAAAPRCTAALHIMEREYTLYEQQVMEMVNRLCSAMQCGDTVDPLFEAVAARLGPHTADAAIAAGAKQAAVVARASPRPRGKEFRDDRFKCETEAFQNT